MPEALFPWEPSFLVPLTLVLAAFVYGRGAAAEPLWRQSCYGCGLVLFYAASFTHFDYYAEHLFFVHRLQHSVLHHLAPFLVGLSRPGAAILAGLPGGMRRALVRLKPVGVLNRPVSAVLLFCALIAFWLVPGVHLYAMLDARLYKLMNALIAVNGLMFWSTVLNGPWKPATRVLMQLAIVPPQIVIGFLLVMTGRDLYPLYDLCGRIGGFDARADQVLGGVVIWLSAMMMSAAGIGVVILRAGLAGRSLGVVASTPPTRHSA